MSLIRIHGLVLFALLLNACGTTAQYNQYQAPATQSKSQPGQGAVVELQRSAREALDRRAYQQAVNYLQRAIKIEPRNPWSWHYLAETYWRSGDNRRCLEMVERSASYSASAADLERANRMLRQMCQLG